MGNTCLSKDLQIQPAIIQNFIQKPQRITLLRADQLKQKHNQNDKTTLDGVNKNQKEFGQTNVERWKYDNYPRISVVEPSEHQMTVKLQKLQECSRPPSQFFVDHKISDCFLTSQTFTIRHSKQANSNQMIKIHSSGGKFRNVSIKVLNQDQICQTKLGQLRKTQFRSEIRGNSTFKKDKNQANSQFNKIQNNQSFILNTVK